MPQSERVQRLGDGIDPRAILGLQGDADRGRAILAAGSIVNRRSCPRLEGVVVELGPDLSKIGAKSWRPDSLQRILEPSRIIDSRYFRYRVAMRSGQLHTGMLIERVEKERMLRDAQNQVVRVAVSDVASLIPQRSSLMPDPLLRGLTAQQAADPLEYLGSLR